MVRVTNFAARHTHLVFSYHSFPTGEVNNMLVFGKRFVIYFEQYVIQGKATTTRQCSPKDLVSPSNNEWTLKDKT